MGKRGPKPGFRARGVPRLALPAPKHLKGEALAAWKHVVGMLNDRGTLRKTDPTLIEAYAANKAMLRQAQDALTEGALVVTPGGGLAVNPACSVINSATIRLKAIITEMGLSPASSGLSASPIPTATNGDESQGPDRWAGILPIAR
jgi:P27 family predicted phage terminase small subunit